MAGPRHSIDGITGYCPGTTAIPRVFGGYGHRRRGSSTPLRPRGPHPPQWAADVVVRVSQGGFGGYVGLVLLLRAGPALGGGRHHHDGRAAPSRPQPTPPAPA